MPEARRTSPTRMGWIWCAWVLAAGTFVLAPAPGCQTILGIHDIDGGPSASNDSGDMSSGSGSSTGSSAGSGSSTGSTGGSGSGVSSSGASSGNPSGSASGSASSGGATGLPACAMPMMGAACTISSATRWAAGVYAIECDVQVDAALTIAPGAILKFDTGHSMTVSSTGTLNATGTAAAPIVFTSLRDNAGGCNTGGTVAPAYQDWKGIALNASGSTFAYSDFYYAGGSDWAALGITSGNRVSVAHSIFGHNRGPTDSPFATPALDTGGAAAGTVIQNNTFYDNRIPWVVSQNFSVDDTNLFDNGAAASMNPQPNEYNGIDYVPSTCNSPIVGNISWSATKVPFIIGNPSYHDLCINSGGQFTLGPNVVLKFFAKGGLTVDATSTFTTGSGDTFTSIKDDANGGDTNADGAMSSPLPGDWSGVSLSASGSTLDSCRFYYAGASDSSALELNASRVTVTHSTFAHNQGPTDNVAATPALDAGSAAGGTVIKGNLFYDNLVPLRISQNFSLDDSNVFDNSAAATMSPQPNKYNGIDYVPSTCNSPIVSNISWSATKVPFIIGSPSYHDLCVESGGQFVLGANVTLKFFAAGHLSVSGTGTLATDGTDIFTSIKDSTHGGNTDPGSNAPMAGDWSGIGENGVCETWSNIYYSTSGCP